MKQGVILKQISALGCSLGLGAHEEDFGHLRTTGLPSIKHGAFGDFQPRIQVINLLQPWIFGSSKNLLQPWKKSDTHRVCL